MNNLIKLNPEFYRNIITEFSLARLLIMPLILLGVFYISGDNDFACLGLFYIITFLWGTYNACKSVPSEVNAKTWDFQRINAINPLKMLVAKLFGSTLYNWYGGVICLLYYLLKTTDEHPIITVLMLVISTVLTHSLGILIGLSDLERRRNDKKIGYIFYFIFTILLTSSVTWSFASRSFFNTVETYLGDAEIGLTWYGIHLNFYIMSFIILLFYTIWSLIGLYRMLRKEFQYKNDSLAWVLFFVTSIALNLGYKINGEGANTLELVIRQGALFGFFSMYFMLFREKKDAILIRSLFDQLRTFDFKKLWYEMPSWFISFSIFMVSALFILIIGDSLQQYIDDTKEGVAGLFSTGNINVLLNQNIRMDLLALIFLVFRDLSLVLYFSMKNMKRSAESITFFYLIILYIFVPILLSLSGGEDLLSGFLPYNQTFISLGVILLQVVLMSYLFLTEYRKQTQDLK